jgi:hypothetical protein
MTYEDLPDPRPLGVRFALGPLPRWAALGVAALLAALALAGAVAAWVDSPRVVVWGTCALVAALAVGYYWSAIRWSDTHRSWPRRRRRRH